MQEFNDQMPADVVRYPMVPIRDVVVFPHTMARFVIGRPASVNALETALAGDRLIFLATQHDATIDEPTSEQIFEVGTVARISHSLRLQDGNIKVMVDGIGRARTMEAGRPVDTSGSIAGIAGEPRFADARALMTTLVGLPEVHRCMGRQWAQYMLGRAVVPADEGALVVAHEAFTKSGHDLRELIVALATSRSFLFRSPAAGEVMP